jgi:hypothetical protein
MSLANLLGQLDPLADVRGRQFERICAWYLRNAPEYKAKLSQVWLWKDWPDAWAGDAGIDLVAEDHHGGLWAIQAKAYDPASYTRLRSFAEREGHTRVRAAYRDDNGFRLGQWVGVQRTNRSRGRLSKERQQRLETLPGWGLGREQSCLGGEVCPPGAARRGRGAQRGPRLLPGRGWLPAGSVGERPAEISAFRPTLRRARATTRSPAGMGSWTRDESPRRMAAAT